MGIKSLIINPGSTSTKIGVFEDETLLFEETLRHSTEEIAQYGSIVEQKGFRKEIITNLLKEKDFEKKLVSTRLDGTLYHFNEVPKINKETMEKISIKGSEKVS